MWNSAKRRAAERGLPFDIQPEDVRVPDKCPVFRLPFEFGNGLTDLSPSLDRLIPALGYVRGNVAVVSWRANRLKNNASLDDLRALVDFYELVLPEPPRWKKSPA